MFRLTCSLFIAALLTLSACSDSSTAGATCAINNGGCDPNAVCQNISTGPSCTCKTGFTGDGLTCSGGTDAGTDAGVDGGTSSGDAGTDSGDAGVDAGIETFSLIVDGGPNSVLSAVATFTYAGPNEIATVSVAYNSSTSSDTTPTTQVHAIAADGGSTVTIPIVGLQANTQYTLQASAFEAGQDASSAPLLTVPVTFMTPALPAGPPTFSITDGGTTTGDTLIARFTGTSPGFLTINDSNGVPVWYFQLPQNGVAAADFQQQPDGTFTYSLLETLADGGPTIPGLGQSTGTYEQIDILGNIIHTWTAVDVPAASSPDAGVDGGTGPVVMLGTDVHEFRLQPNGDALLFGLTAQTQDLSALHGSSSATVIGAVLERVTSSGDLAFVWNSFDYTSVANVSCPSANVTGHTVDFSHANSIDVSSDGNYIISLRNLSQVLKIDSTTGEVLWKLGGKDGDFTFMSDSLGGFSCQHGARELPNGDILVFDDGQHGTRVVEYAVDPIGLTATQTFTYTPATTTTNPTVSYAERLDNGNTLVTLETAHKVQEVTQTGTVVWELTDPSGGQLYRAYRLKSLYQPPGSMLPPP